MKGVNKPILAGPDVVRPQDPLLLFDNEAIKDTVDHLSQEIEVAGYREGSLFIFIDSTGAPTTVHIEVEFLDRWKGKWHTLKQGPFAALYYEDGDTASGIAEVITFMVVGRSMRVKLTGAGTSGSAYFNVNISVDLRN